MKLLFLVLQLFLGFFLVAIFTPDWPWLFYVYAAVLILARLIAWWESIQNYFAEQKRKDIIADLNTATQTKKTTDGSPVSARIVTDGGRPVAEIRQADLQTIDGEKAVVGELENLSVHVFSAVTLRVLMRDEEEDILGEEQSFLHQMGPQEVWRFRVPSRWPQTEGFSLNVDVRVHG